VIRGPDSDPNRAIRIPQPEESRVAYSVNDHIALRRVSDIAPSPDGRWLAVVVQRLDRDGGKYVSDLWKVPTDGGPAVQLTRGDCKDTAPCFRADGALGFLSNRQPNEIKPDEEADKRAQVWILPAAGGEPQQLTDEPLGVEAFKFARAADRLIVLAPLIPGVAHEKQRETATDRAKNGPSARRYTRQPVRHWDHWLHDDPDRADTHVIAYESALDPRNAKRIDLTPDARREFAIEPAFDVSADGRLVAITYATLGADREDDTCVLLIDCATGAARKLAGATNTNVEHPRFSPDGNTIAVVRSTRSPKIVVRPLLTLIDAASGNLRELAAGWDRWPVGHEWTDDGRALVCCADDEGHVPVFRVDGGDGTRVERISAAGAGGAHSQLTPLADGRIACIRSTLLDAPECYVFDAQPNAAPQALARLSGFTPASEWAEVESFKVPSTDGTPIHSLMVKPKGARGKLPTLLWIHGGPIGMDADGWHWRWNPLLAVAAGYAVVLPNPRGSTGYGQPFIQGIWGNVWGDQCYEDLMAVTDALEKRADVDGARLMAMGGSFGGYMTNWIGSQTNRFKCLITHASIATMAQFTGTTDHPAWWYLEMGGEDPYADPLRFDRYAPIRFIKQWKTPTLIIHGEKDYRCPVNEALNLFEALQYHGVPSELLLFPDENHWILKPRNIVAWYEGVLGFIKRHME
jgi:dipeptidyl aminopeptidase/acylaminoacyl peptidase